VYWFCTKFGQLILSKIIKIVATRCQILRPKSTKFDLGSGSTPDPAGGAYNAPPDPLAGFRGPTSKGEGKGGRGREGREKGGNEGRVDPQGFAEITPLFSDAITKALGRFHCHQPRQICYVSIFMTYSCGL